MRGKNIQFDAGLVGQGGKARKRSERNKELKIMNRRKDLLNALAEHKPCNGIVLSEEDINAVLSKMIAYYEINDMETSDMHSRIFKTLYVYGGFKNYDKVASAYYISPYTLDRYRQRYNRLAERLIKEQIQNKKIKIQGDRQ